MKTLLLFLLLCLPAFASRVNLAFDAVSGAAGYALEVKPEGGEWRWHVSFTGTSLKVEGLTPGKYTFRVVAVSPEGAWSDPSGEVTATILAAPQNLHIDLTATAALQMSPDMKTWTTVATADVPEGDRMFFRTVFE